MALRFLVNRRFKWLHADQVLSVVLENPDEILGTKEGRVLAVAKNRNGPEGPLAPFTLEYIALGYHEDGREYGNLYVEPQLDRPVTVEQKPPKIDKNIRVFEQAVTDSLIAYGEAFRISRGQGPTVQAVRLSPTVRDLFFERYPVAEEQPGETPEEIAKKRYEAKRKAFQRAVGKMPTAYATESVGDVEWIWQVRTASRRPAGDARDTGDTA